MNKRFASVLIFAVAVAALASFVLYRQLSVRLTDSAKAPTTKVVVANRDLGVGTLIGNMDVRVADWTGSAPQNSILKIEDTMGRGVVANIYAGEPLLENRLAPRGAGAGLAATIPTGMRAVAVRVNEVVGLAGFVVPGMRVDVLIAGNPPGTNTNTTGPVTKTLLQNIEVLSAGQNIQKDAEGKPVNVQVVNLLVTPEQAEILSLASNETRIQLVLRNPLDRDQSKTSGITLANLYAGTTGHPVTTSASPDTAKPRPRAPKPVEVAPKEKPASSVTIEVINGSQRTTAKFKEKENSEEK